MHLGMMKEGRTKKIDELVAQALRSLGLERGLQEHEVCAVWPEVVGQMIASRTKSLEVREGRLWVAFSSSVVRNEMMMVREGLAKALNERVGAEVVREVIIR